MIRGYCIGGGLGIAMCCDLRIATENSTFAVPAAKLGLGYGHAGVKRLMDVVGPSFTKEIFYTARQFNAEEAKTMGLDQSRGAERRARELREEIRRDDRRQRAAHHQGAEDRGRRTGQGRVEARCRRAWKTVVNTCFRSKDYIEGRDAFMEKRKPVFTGT